MKHFLIDICYTAPLEQIDMILGEHRGFLQTGFERGLLLFSGPKIPRTGGIVIARAPELTSIQQFFEQDPYFVHQAASYTFTEFTPVKYQSFLENWVKSE